MELNLNQPAQDRQASLLAARDVALNGLTTIEYSRKRAFKLCYWILRWGVTSPTLLDKVARSKRRGIGKKLVGKNLLKQSKTSGGGFSKGTPRHILTLTKIGLAFLLESGLDGDTDYKLIDPTKVREDKLRHDFIAQLFTFENLEDGNIVDFIPEFLNKESHKANTKIADVIWIQVDGTRIGLEVELTPKFSRSLDQFIYGVIMALLDKKVDRFLLLTDKQSIIDRYTEAMNSKSVPIWFKNKQGRWTKKDEPFVIPSFIKNEERFVCVYQSNL